MNFIFIIQKQNKIQIQIKLIKNINYLIFKFFSFYGEYFVQLPVTFLRNNKIVIDFNSLKVFKTILYKIIYVLCFCWSSSFDLVGYNFNLQKRLKKNILRLNLGFSKHKILVFFANNIRIFGQKRYFTIFSSNIQSYFVITNFLLNLRNIFPYKKRGIVPAIVPSIWLKPGKKTKFK